MARLIRRLAVLASAGAVGATLAVAPAVAAPTWRPVTNLFADLSATGGSAFTPAIALDVAGNATVVWSRSNGTQYVVQASYRPVGGTWTAPVDLVSGGWFEAPQVVVDAAGTATAIWRRTDTDRSVVQSASRTAAGAWSAPVDVSTDPSVDYTVRDVPQIAVDGAGVVTATWSRFEKAQPWRFTAQSATRALDGTWSTPVDLSLASSRARRTDVTVDAAGNATAVWVADGRVEAASRPPGGTWSAPTPISTTAGDRGNPRVVVDPAGTVTAIWSSFTAGVYGVQTASRPLGGAWTTVDLAQGEIFDTPAIAVDRSGAATAVWQQHDGDGWIITSATRESGTWSRPVSLSTPAHDSWDPQVAVDPSGAATALWSREDEDYERVVEAARRDSGGEWSEPIDLSPRGEAWNPQVAIDSAGNATAAWSRKDGTSWIVQARGLDAAGPVVTEITGATSRVGARARAYSVKAHDVWSRVASARWTFPDGTTATGTSVSYAGNGGSGPVRVVLTDSVGNATACTYTTTFSCRPTKRVAPVIVDAALSGRKVRAAGSDSKVAKTARATIELSTDAKVTFTLRKAGSRPVVLVKRLDAGRNVVAIRARLGAGKVLAPGRWKVVMTAKNRFGTSKKETLRLRVVR